MQNNGTMPDLITVARTRLLIKLWGGPALSHPGLALFFLYTYNYIRDNVCFKYIYNLIHLVFLVFSTFPCRFLRMPPRSTTTGELPNTDCVKKVDLIITGWCTPFFLLLFNRSYMIAWIGVGFALISSILFSCAAICLRREREKEEAVNMQYLMPGTLLYN